MISEIHHAERVQALKETGAKTMASRKNGANRPNGLMDYMDFQGLLPTPRASKITGTDREDFTPSLPGLMNRGLLPTPTAQNYKGASSTEALEKRGRLKDKADDLANQFAVSGKSSQLNPRFVAEMMGFPVNWTELPFQSGETNPSKPTATQ